MAKLSVKNVTAALQENRGVVTYAARALGVTRCALWRFLQKHPDLEEVRNEARDEFLDVCERQIIDAVYAGDIQTTRWALELLGKDRGYSRRIENTGADGAPLIPFATERRVIDHRSEE